MKSYRIVEYNYDSPSNPFEGKSFILIGKVKGVKNRLLCFCLQTGKIIMFYKHEIKYKKIEL